MNDRSSQLHRLRIDRANPPAEGRPWLWWLAGSVVVLTLAGGGAFLTQVVFRLTVSPDLMLMGIVGACAIGVLGGLFPAIRAARQPIATALRAV